MFGLEYASVGRTMFSCLVSIYFVASCSVHVKKIGLYLQDGDHGDDDDDEDGPREADLEGRVEKYIGVKVKACIIFI